MQLGKRTFNSLAQRVRYKTCYLNASTVSSGYETVAKLFEGVRHINWVIVMTNAPRKFTVDKSASLEGLQVKRPIKKSVEMILIPKHLRMEWTDAMALDLELPPMAFRVGCVIGNHFNRHSGKTYIAQETLARVMGKSEGTIWNAIQELEKRGYLIVERKELGVRSDGRRVCGGRGIANTYLPAFERSQLVATNSGQKLAARCDQIWAQRSQKPKRKVTAHCVPTLTPPSEENPKR